MIRFVCECGKQLQAREENAGKAVLCPACQRQLTVPAAPPSSSAVQTEEPAAPAPMSEGMQQDRPLLRDEPEREEEQEIEDRPLPQPVGNSGKAIASLVLGILSLFCNFLSGLPALILGLLALRDIGRGRGRLSGHGLAIAGIVTACAGTLFNCMLLLPALLIPAVQRVREAAEQTESQKNLKIMGLALQNYHDAENGLPAAALRDKNGRTLLSWRVAILGYIGQQNLYHQFNLDEPWDSPNNRSLLSQMPKVYNCPAVSTPPGETIYQTFVGNGAAFEKSRRLRIPADFPDGISNTILIVEAAQAVPWTKPEDLPFDPDKPIAPLLKAYRHGYHILLGDGSVKLLPLSTPESTLKVAITRNAGDVVNWP